MRAYFFGLALAATLACSNNEAQDDDSSSTTSSSTTTSTGGNGTGGNATGGTATGGSCTSAATFELTSSAVADMGLLPVQYKCISQWPGRGLNISPPLAWTPGPAGTLSYAVFFRDLSGQRPFPHSAIWDIPACVFELPEDVEKTANPSDVPGAKQCRAYNGQFGYEGPCLEADPNPRTYQFEAYALSVATLPGVTTDSTLAQVEAALVTNALASDTLTVIEDDP